jgi:hypothetical protein
MHILACLEPSRVHADQLLTRYGCQVLRVMICDDTKYIACL